MNGFDDLSRADLLGLPLKPWHESRVYDSVLLLSTRRKHESGWAMVAIVGVRDGEVVECASTCSDDIEWRVPPDARGFRMDCVMRTGAMHAWSRDHKFRVGHALSSITIELVKA